MKKLNMEKYIDIERTLTDIRFFNVLIKNPKILNYSKEKYLIVNDNFNSDMKYMNRLNELRGGYQYGEDFLLLFEDFNHSDGNNKDEVIKYSKEMIKSLWKDLLEELEKLK